MKYEYKTIVLFGDTRADGWDKNTLDSYGESGWELVSVISEESPKRIIAYLKRSK